MSTLVGTKGQVTIERGIREALGVKPGWWALQRRVGQQEAVEQAWDAAAMEAYGHEVEPARAEERVA